MRGSRTPPRASTAPCAAAARVRSEARSSSCSPRDLTRFAELRALGARAFALLDDEGSGSVSAARALERLVRAEAADSSPLALGLEAWSALLHEVSGLDPAQTVLRTEWMAWVDGHCASSCVPYEIKELHDELRAMCDDLRRCRAAGVEACAGAVAAGPAGAASSAQRRSVQRRLDSSLRVERRDAPALLPSAAVAEAELVAAHDAVATLHAQLARSDAALAAEEEAEADLRDDLAAARAKLQRMAEQLAAHRSPARRTAAAAAACSRTAALAAAHASTATAASAALTARFAYAQRRAALSIAASGATACAVVAASAAEDNALAAARAFAAAQHAIASADAARALAAARARAAERLRDAMLAELEGGEFSFIYCYISLESCSQF